MRVNKRRKVGDYYLDIEELIESIDEIYSSALRQASLEALEGRLDELQLAAKVDEKKIKAEALRSVLEAQQAKS